jgi:hypothetical protein
MKFAEYSVAPTASINIPGNNQIATVRTPAAPVVLVTGNLR